jgi:hypothetical protein
MAANAVPTSTVRPSFRRAPAAVSKSAANAAASADIPTPKKCQPLSIAALSRPKKWSSSAGRAAAVPPKARMGGDALTQAVPHYDSIGTTPLEN